MPILQIRLFGHFQLLYDETPLTTIKGARLQALWAYLLLHRDRAHPRRRLANLFWPARAEGQAPSNLRNKLAVLRKKFPASHDFLYDDDEILQWRTDAAFRLDVAEFELAIQQAKQARYKQDQPTRSAALAQAVTLYTGELLPHLHDDWVLAARLRLRNQFAAALSDLITLLQAQADYTTAIHYAQRLLHENSLSEAAYRQLMELHLLNGEPADALRVYTTCKEMLQRALHVAPSPATETIHQRIVDLISASDTPTNPPLAPPLSSAALQELQRLAAVWLHDDNPRLFTGVTHFLARLATLLAAQGALNDALRIVERTFIILSATDEATWEAELHCLHGKLLWQQNRPKAEIELCFRKAIAVARRQNAKFLELCALAHLCQLCQQEAELASLQQQVRNLYPFFRSQYTEAEFQSVWLLFTEIM